MVAASVSASWPLVRVIVCGVLNTVLSKSIVSGPPVRIRLADRPAQGAGAAVVKRAGYGERRQQSAVLQRQQGRPHPPPSPRFDRPPPELFAHRSLCCDSSTSSTSTWCISVFEIEPASCDKDHRPAAQTERRGGVGTARWSVRPPLHCESFSEGAVTRCWSHQVGIDCNAILPGAPGSGLRLVHPQQGLGLGTEADEFLALGLVFPHSLEDHSNESS